MRRSRLAAMTLGFGSVALMVAALTFAWLSASRGVGEFSLLDALWGSSFLPFPVIGALIASRRPNSPIGWLFCGATLPVILSLALFEYARFDLAASDGSLPFSEAAAWLSNWVALPGALAVVLLLVLFPTGRYRSRRWRWVTRVAAVSSIGIVSSNAFTDEPIADIGIQNPLGVAPLTGALDVVSSVGGFALTAAIVVALAAPFLRFKGARGDERQQLRWLIYGLAAFAVAIAALATLEPTGFSDGPGGVFVFVVGISLIPTSIAIAILKYHLYDIDVVINRTLVYGVMTAILAGTYAGIVFVLQSALAPFTQQNDLAIASSTLAVAALFRPLRARVQGFIDRRFYRRKFDAQVTLESFSAHMRDEVELESLTHRLVGVVGDTFQPAHVSLWLRDTETSRTFPSTDGTVTIPERWSATKERI